MNKKILKTLYFDRVENNDIVKIRIKTPCFTTRSIITFKVTRIKHDNELMVNKELLFTYGFEALDNDIDLMMIRDWARDGLI